MRDPGHGHRKQVREKALWKRRPGFALFSLGKCRWRLTHPSHPDVQQGPAAAVKMAARITTFYAGPTSSCNQDVKVQESRRFPKYESAYACTVNYCYKRTTLRGPFHRAFHGSNASALFRVSETAEVHTTHGRLLSPGSPSVPLETVSPDREKWKMTQDGHRMPSFSLTECVNQFLCLSVEQCGKHYPQLK
ncbi:hypothetical protein MG293_011265 [Ovis ammon polii]|uniref:Uncharacterized protein n=1 Tax=Ovis ammon polii TaxID=230172 RepID=A0AAD4U282_OVIAM|nr:hypothetical protein MG293_011265 [Ovis ammon polii]